MVLLGQVTCGGYKHKIALVGEGDPFSASSMSRKSHPLEKEDLIFFLLLMLHLEEKFNFTAC